MNTHITSTHTYPIKKDHLLIYLGLALSTSSLLFNYWEPANYLKYFMLIPSLAITIKTINSKKIKTNLSTPSAKLFLLLFAHAAISTLIAPNKFTAIDVIIYLNIALFAIAASSIPLNIRKTFWIFSLFFLLWAAQQVNLYGLNETFGSMGPSYNSTSGSKLKFAIPCYIFGIYFIYFLWKRDRQYLLFSALGIAITSKRAAMLALLLITILHFSPEIIRRAIFNKKTMIAANVAWLFISNIIASAYFSELIHETLGVSASAFTMGRNLIYAAALELSSNTWLSFFLGSGEGSTYTHLAAHPSLEVFNGIDKVLLHNEILRLYIEGGAPLLFAALLLMYPKKHDDLSWSCLLFINIISFFDNTLVYSLVWYYLIVITTPRQPAATKQ